MRDKLIETDLENGVLRRRKNRLEGIKTRLEKVKSDTQNVEQFEKDLKELGKNAPEDMEWLLKEIDRLRSGLKSAEAMLTSVSKYHGSVHFSENIPEQNVKDVLTIVRDALK